MRKIYRHTIVIGTSLCGALTALAGTAAQAQTSGQYYDQQGQPVFLPNTSSSYNQQGFNLPSAPSSHGQDIVRGSGGISCQSAIGSGGAQFDMGVIGTNDIFDRESAAVYGRFTVPLGKRAKRVDCTKLYDLEISRLKMELQLMRAGAMGSMVDPQSAKSVALQASRGQMPPPKEADMPILDSRPNATKPFTLNVNPPGKPQQAAETKAAEKPSSVPTASEVKADANLPVRMAIIAPHAVQPIRATPLHSSGQDTMPIGTVKIANYGQAKMGSGYYAQIGAFSSIENAKKAWWQHTEKVPGDLTNYQALAKPKRKGEKTLYLLQAGPFASKQDTTTLCRKIGNGCYAVRT